MPSRKSLKNTKIKKTEVLNEESLVPQESPVRPAPATSHSQLIRNILIILLVALILIALKFKNLFIVATVNGKPIDRLSFEQELNNKYGQQTLENMISEQVILSEAEKRNIKVEKDEVDKKIKEIEDRLKGQVSLDEALLAQGLTRESFRKQLEIQIVIDKMFAKDAKITDKEIDEYLAQNQETLASSTDTAKLRTDVKEMLLQQKVGDLFDKWFTEAKKKANVVKF